MAEVGLTSPQAIHVVGVGGAGMSALASVLRAMGHRVSGSDLKASPGLERLRAQGVVVTVGHAAGNVGAVDALAVSTAVPERNAEVTRAIFGAQPGAERDLALLNAGAAIYAGGKADTLGRLRCLEALGNQATVCAPRLDRMLPAHRGGDVTGARAHATSHSRRRRVA